MPASRTRMNRQEAEMLAISAFSHLAVEDGLLARFCALTGIAPTAMRVAVNDPNFLGSVLEFYLGDEPTLLAFAAACNVDPSQVATAREILDGRDRE